MNIQEDNHENIKKYLLQMKSINHEIICFLEKENTINDDYQNIIKLLEDNEIQNNKYDLKALLYLISNISNNHLRNHDFFKKIQHILLFLKDSIKNFYSNYEIFEIFQNNKRMLLLLFEEEFIIPDQSVAATITKDKYINKFYPEYFYTEFKDLFDEKTCQKIESRNQKYKKVSNLAAKDPENFEQKRKNGENDEHICQLIRNDSIDQFIIYVNKNKLTFSGIVQPSIFETNPFLLDKKPTFIEYSALFGSVLIFRFLLINEIPLTPSLWLYAIHGRNFELIQLLVKNNIKPNDKSYKECFIESIKCHHFQMAKYFNEKINNREKDMSINEQCIRYYNYEYIPYDVENNFAYFYEFCQYDYFKIVQFLLKTTKLDLNSKRILKLLFLLCL